MGGSDFATRGLWWYGTSSVCATCIQDDLALISRSANGFGYRPDDHGDSASTATPLTVSGNQVSGAGILTMTSDLDYFSFTTDAGQISMSVGVPANVNNLDAVLQLRDAGGALIASADPSTSFGATITATVAAGSYRPVVVSHGTYGDVGQYTVSGTRSSSTTDTTPPVVSSVTASGISSSGATIGWTTNEAATSQVEYGTTTSYGSTTALDTTLGISHSVSLTGLSASTLYHYRVKSQDASGNLAISGDFTFTTGAPPDTTPPVISVVTASGLSTSGATITWVTNEPSDSQVEYGTTTGYGNVTPINPSLSTTHSVVLSGLLGGTLYHYRVKSKDASGNPAISADFTFSTLNAPADAIPPTVSITAPLDNSAVTSKGTITLQATASDNVGVTRVDFFVNGTLLSTDAAAPYSATWKVPAKRNAIYTLSARASDAAGNTATASVTVTAK